MHHLTQSQVKSLLRSVPDERDRTGLLVMYLHGLRVSEMTALRVKDVEGGYIRVQRLKRSAKTEQLLISSSDVDSDEKTQLEDLITRYDLKPNDLLFPMHRSTVWRIVKKAGEDAGLPLHLCHPHVFKHSIAMRMVNRIGIEELKQYLGHRSLNSTGMYLRVTDAQASQAVVNALEDMPK